MSPVVPVVDVAVLDQYAAWDDAWRDLTRRAEANVFADPAFLLPALRYLASKRRVRLVLIWETSQRVKLIGVAAIEAPLGGLGFARVWRSEQAALGALLVDSGAAASALAALLGWVEATWPWGAGLRLRWLEPDGVIAQVVAATAVVEVVETVQRAALQFGSARVRESGKRHKESARLARRLAEHGRLESRVAGDAAAIERFLSLEAGGWKGARGTALADDPGLAGFAREMLAAFAWEGRLRIHELALDDAPVAAGVELRAGRRAFFWKTAYDEGYSAYSPGVLLTRALTERLIADGDVDFVDSCAAPNHPMIDRLWPDRLKLVDLVVARRAKPHFAAAAALARNFVAARDRVKRLAASWLRRKPS